MNWEEKREKKKGIEDFFSVEKYFNSKKKKK
jgi:hypothetical protein